MRRPLRRAVLLAGLAGGAALLGLPAPRPAAGQARMVGPGDATDGPRPDGHLQFTFPVERDASQRLEAVLDYLKKTSVPWDVVCGTAQQLLDAKSDSFYPVRDPGGKETGGLVSVKAKVSEVLGGLPPAGRQFYELAFGPAAEARLKDAVAAGYDRAALADLAQRYFHTRAGAQAALLLAGLDLDAGLYPEAAYGYQRLLARADGDDLSARTLFKAAVAFKRSGDPRQAEAVARLMDRAEKKLPRGGLGFGRTAYGADDLRRELDRPAGGPPRLGDGYATMRYGNPAHTGAGAGGTPFLAAAFEVRAPTRKDEEWAAGADWVEDKLSQALKAVDPTKGQVVIPGLFPVTAPDLVVYRTYDGVYATVTRDGYVAFKGTPDEQTFQAGDLLWAHEAAGAVQTLLVQSDRHPAIGWYDSFWARNAPGLLSENAQAGSLSHDGRLVYFVDDLAIPPLPPPAGPNVAFAAPVPLPVTTGAADHNRLVAVGLDTGTLRWALGRPAATPGEPDDPAADALRATEGAYFLGPPLPLDGKLYVLFEKNSQVKLACLDPQKVTQAPQPGGKPPETYPELVWVQNLGAATTRVGQDSLRRVQPCYLAYADGVLVCPTNCGAVVAVDVNARSLLWARTYASGPTPAASPGGPPGAGGRLAPAAQPWDGYGAPRPVPTDRWRAAAPILAAGKVVVAAYDSDRLLCLDLRTGADVWADDRRKADLYVGGVVGGNVLVVGQHSVRALRLDGDGHGRPAAAWDEVKTDGTPTGHGAATGDGVYYLPVAAGPDGKEPQVVAVDAAAGKVKTRTAYRRKDPAGGPVGFRADARVALGNLVFHDGQLFSQSAAGLAAFPLSDLKRKEMTRLLAANPRDPRGLFDRGELLLEDGQVRAALADLKEAERNDPPDPLRRKIRDKLYAGYTDLLRADFRAAEPILAEYEQLLDPPADAPDPAGRQRQADERARRRGLYLALLAKGREAQGRLPEAFDAYRAFAALGGAKEPVDIPDEPAGKTRPDVWASGKIDAMVRAAPAAARGPLADRVRAAWEAARGATDPGPLREFAAAFGPAFPEGREARLALADRLADKGTEDATREAQAVLMRLWAAADDDPTAARAVDRLARLMTRRGMPEDAVGLYALLGGRYAGAPLGDGRTGADAYAEVVTDKRMLPYLDPGRGPAATRYRVTAEPAAGRVAAAGSVPLTPDGDLFPLFRRLRFDLTQVGPGGGDESWALVVTDRVTGDERCRFTGLAGPGQLAGGGGGRWAQGAAPVPADKIAHASGHLLLLTVGRMAYCFDLAEKRRLWDYDLLGAGSTGTPPAADQTPDGDTVFRFDDGWELRLGRSAVLHPTYACLVTRDGLVAVDPATREKLWVRTNVSRKVQVFGDAGHVFLVDGGAARALRAADGAPVPGVKDFAPLFAPGRDGAPAKVAVFGRHVLATEGGAGRAPRVLRLVDPLAGADVWRKEYPPGSLVLKTLAPDLTGCLLPDGLAEVVDGRSGEVLARCRLDPDAAAAHLKDPAGRPAVTAPTLLADADRFYLFLTRGPDPGRPAGFAGGALGARTLPVNGPAWAFDRATGRRLWYADRLFDGQQVVLDRFDELPVVAAAAGGRDRSDQPVVQVTLVDKRTGRLVYHKGHNPGSAFLAVGYDPRKREFDLVKQDVRVKVALDDEAPGR